MDTSKIVGEKIKALREDKTIKSGKTRRAA